MKTHLFRNLKLLSVLAVTSALTAVHMNAAPEVYDIDVPHSGVTFKVTHILNKVHGKFNDFKGTLTLDVDNLDNSKVEISIPVKSVNTGNKDRDAHLQTADFFTAEKHPEITFKSTKWKKTGDKQFEITGDLSMNGVTKPVTLQATLHGFAEHPMNKKKVTGWAATTTLNRSEWNVSYGLPMVSDKVEIELSVQGHLRSE